MVACLFGTLAESKLMAQGPEALPPLKGIESTKIPLITCIVPADNKKNTRLIISQIILDTFRSLKMQYPETSEERRQELESIRKQL